MSQSIFTVRSFVDHHCTTNLDLERDAAKAWVRGRIEAIRSGTSVETSILVFEVPTDHKAGGFYGTWTPLLGWTTN